MNRRVVVSVTLSFLLAVSCAHGSRVPDLSNEPFRIGREDVVEVSVWRDGDLSRVVPVRPDGFVSLPLVGELRAEGKTPAGFAAEIAETLKPYLQDPKVTVIVREVHSSRVYVTGEVAHPGSYVLRGRMSLLQAVALAGGFSDFASREDIMVIRHGEGGGRYLVRYSDLVRGDEEERAEVYLRPGDTVVVP